MGPQRDWRGGRDDVVPGAGHAQPARKHGLGAYCVHVTGAMMLNRHSKTQKVQGPSSLTNAGSHRQNQKLHICPCILHS